MCLMEVASCFNMHALFGTGVMWHMVVLRFNDPPRIFSPHKCYSFSSKNRRRHNGQFCDFLCLTTDSEFIGHFCDSICDSMIGLSGVFKAWNYGVWMEVGELASSSSWSTQQHNIVNAALYKFCWEFIFFKLYLFYFKNKKSFKCSSFPWRNQKAFFAKQSVCGCHAIPKGIWIMHFSSTEGCWN